MKLLQHKKAFTYLLAVSLLVSILLVVFLNFNRYNYFDQQEVFKARISTMDDFVTDFTQDLHRATYISSFRALLSLEDYVASTGQFLNDTEESFRETFFYGTINGTPAPLMNASSFEDYLARVNSLAGKIDINASINVTSINLSHIDPWHLSVVIQADVNITDKRGIAAWEYNATYVTEVPIYDLRDPLYSSFTGNKVPHTVREYPYSVLVNQTNTTNLQELINESYYVATPFAPTFLQRFENNITPNPFGIESIVDIGDLSAQDISVFEERIKIDFIYFNDLGGDKICEVQNMPEGSYFVIRKDHNLTYQIENLTYKNGTDCP